MNDSQTRQLREDLTKLLRSEIIEDEAAARRMGISVRELKSLWSKTREVENARRFLDELGVEYSDVLTLKEYCGCDRDPRTNIDLDHVCPDVVAIIKQEPVGIELTAFAPNEEEDRLSAMMWRVSEINRTTISCAYPQLNGFSIHYSPNRTNIVRDRHVAKFAQQLADLVSSEHAREPFADHEDRHIPSHLERLSKPFENWDLLKQHVRSVTIHHRISNKGLPFSVPPGGFASTFGTSLDHLLTKLTAKTKSRSKALSIGITHHWLVIHATGAPVSSRIAPLWRGVIDVC